MFVGVEGLVMIAAKSCEVYSLKPKECFSVLLMSDGRVSSVLLGSVCVLPIVIVTYLLSHAVMAVLSS